MNLPLYLSRKVVDLSHFPLKNNFLLFVMRTMDRFKASADPDRMQLPVASAPYTMSAVNFCQSPGAPALILADNSELCDTETQDSPQACRPGQGML